MKQQKEYHVYLWNPSVCSLILQYSEFHPLTEATPFTLSPLVMFQVGRQSHFNSSLTGTKTLHPLIWGDTGTGATTECADNLLKLHKRNTEQVGVTKLLISFFIKSINWHITERLTFLRNSSATMRALALTDSFISLTSLSISSIKWMTKSTNLCLYICSVWKLVMRKLMSYPWGEKRRKFTGKILHYIRAF